LRVGLRSNPGEGEPQRALDRIARPELPDIPDAIRSIAPREREVMSIIVIAVHVH
jgi:hypothetical protein